MRKRRAAKAFVPVGYYAAERLDLGEDGGLHFGRERGERSTLIAPRASGGRVPPLRSKTTRRAYVSPLRVRSRTRSASGWRFTRLESMRQRTGIP